MTLLTKKIKERAEAQYQKGSSMDQMVVAKFFHPCSDWTWYLMNKDPKDSYCWGIVDGFEVEMGSFDIDELQNVVGPMGLGVERDRSWTPIPANDVWRILNER